MQTGWLLDGVMVTGKLEIDGKTYEFYENGALKVR